MKRPLLIGSAVVIGLALVIGLGIWIFFDAGQFRPALEDKLSVALGRRVSVGSVRLALLSGAISVDDLAIADDPAFGARPFITAKSVSVGVDLLPLILSRSLRVESFRLQEPHVVLLRSPSGTWNFSRIGAASSPKTKGSAPQSASAGAMSVVIQKITIVGGQVVVATVGTQGKERVYDDVNVEVSAVSFTSRFPLQATAKTPGGGSAKLDGQAGPFNPIDAARTPFQASVDLERLDIASTGFVDPRSSGLAGIVSFSGAWDSDGNTLKSKGKVTAAGLQLVAGASQSRVPVEIDYASDYTASAQRGVLTENDVHIGNAVARLTGDYNFVGDTPSVRMTLVGQKMPVTDLEAALPAIGVTLPSGASLKQGTLDTNFAINGPVDRLVITGPIHLADAKMAGFDLGRKLAAVAALAGLPKNGETVIDTVTSTLRVGPHGIQVDALNVIAPSIGTLRGSGTIAPGGAIDFTMLATLTGSGALAGGLSRLGSLGQPANGIPFRIQGTTSNPVFAPDVRKAAGNALKSGERKATEHLGDLVKRKK
jgi:AsmA protein